jgi:hypothetical protein
VPGPIQSLDENSAMLGGERRFMNHGSPWTTYRTRFLVRARQLTERLVFTDVLGREQSGEPGDYLVESSEGVRRITAKIVFEDIYVPLASAVPVADGAGVHDQAVGLISLAGPLAGPSTPTERRSSSAA